MTVRITEHLARKVLSLVRQGLVSGLGAPAPGQMCVQAAVNYAMGASHDDQPVCVDSSLRDVGIELNDLPWQSDQARAKGMQRFAIAQLGTSNKTSGFDYAKFEDRVWEKMKEKTGNPDLHRPEYEVVSWATDALHPDLHKEINWNKLGTTMANLFADVLEEMKTPGSKYTCLIQLPDKELPVVK